MHLLILFKPGLIMNSVLLSARIQALIIELEMKVKELLINILMDKLGKINWLISKIKGALKYLHQQVLELQLKTWTSLSF